MIRREFLLVLLSSAGLLARAPAAFAKDGDSGGGGSGSGGGGSGSGGGGDDDDGGGDHDDDDGDDDRDDDKARDAVRDGKAAPLGDILKQVRKRVQGQVVRVRLTGRGDRLTYRIKMIDTESRLIEVSVNAVSGKIVRVKGN